MPLYEYKCASCGDVFEVIQKFSDEPLHEHPGCGGPVERLISASALQFKGSGWYVTDYGRNSSGSDKHKSEAKSAGKDAGKDGSKDGGKNGTSKSEANSAKETSTSAKSDKSS
jgi:putative FmdB family regulatory protein